MHIFTYRDHYYIYDTGSASLHECDAATAKVLEGHTTEVSDEELKNALRDIEGLKKEGLLYKEEPKAYPVKSSEAKALCLHVSHDCNLRCRYCFADEGAYHSVRETMSFETAKAAIDFLLRESGSRKVLEVDFFGGEPLMNFETVKNTVRYAKEEGAKRGKKFLFTTTTNGLLLDDEIIGFFNEEMENVVLSLDGRREVHDAVRKTVSGKGSFDAVIDKIKKFVRARGDKHYYVRGTFTAKNPDFSKDVLFLADNGFDSISMEPVVTDIPDLQITEELLPRIEQEYETLAEEYIRREEEGKGFLFFHFNIDIEGRGTNIFPSCRTGIFTLAISLQATKILLWATCSRERSTGTSAKNLPKAVCSRARSATGVLQNSSVQAAATRIIITITAISTIPMR